MNFITIRKIRKLAVALLLFSGFFSKTLFAEVRTLTLEQAIESAVKNNHDIITSRLSLKKADAAVDEAFGNALPAVSFSGNYTRNLKLPAFFMPNYFANRPDQIVPITIGADNSYQVGGTVTQVLFNSAVLTAIGTSKTYSSAAMEQYKSSVSKTVQNVRKTYFGVLLAKEVVKAMHTTFDNANENLKQVKAFYSEGMIPEFDKIRAEVAVENIRPVMLQSETAYSNAINGLKMLIGADMTDNIEVAGELTVADTSEISSQKAQEQMLKSNFDLTTLRTVTKVNEDVISLRMSEYYPSLVAFGNYTYMGQSNTWDFTNVTTSSVGINLSLSLFQGFQSNARLQQAKIDFQTSETRVNQLEEALKMQLKNTLLQLDVAKSRMEAQQQTIEQAEKGYSIAVIRYKEGMGSQMEINDADNALLQAKINKAQAVYDYLGAKADYDNLTGSIDSKYLRISR